MITWIWDVWQQQRIVTALALIWTFLVFTHWSANCTHKCSVGEAAGTAACNEGSRVPRSAPASLRPPNKVSLQRTSGCSTGILARRRWVLPVLRSSSQSAGNKTDGTLEYYIWGNSEDNTHISNQALSPDRWNKPRLTTGMLVLILFLVLYQF